MGKGYRTRRLKLKRHDAGNDRHNKTVAYEMKAARLSDEHHRSRSRSRRRLK